MEKATITQTINLPLQKVWDFWNKPEHITKWNQASPEWHCPSAKNNLEVGGKLETRMEAKDGSFGFDFIGIYQEIIPYQKIKYSLEDDRQVEIIFQELSPTQTKVTETFDLETENSAEMQRQGWQSILDNFKTYSENQ
jgi:uncharacterized protein YndB with AHSA1/START domain